MRIGFRSAAASGGDLEIAQRVGIPVIELDYTPEVRPQYQEIERRLKDYGIGICALITAEQFDLDGFKRALDWTARLGANAFVSHPHYLKPWDKDGIRQFADVFGPAAEYAQKLRVALAVQSCTLRPESWDVMFSAVPALGLKYDPSFTLEAGESYRAEIVRYGPRIVHVHVKDEMLIGRETDFSHGIMRYQYCPAGMGDINWGSVIALLVEAGYRGDLSVETHSQFWSDNLEWDLTLCKRHLEQFIPPALRG